MEGSIDAISQNIMTGYMAQVESAMKISGILSEHNSDSNDFTGDDIICGLVYRLMIPMTDDEMKDSWDKATEIMDPDPSSSSDDEDTDGAEYDEIEESYEKPILQRKIKTNNCNCDICSKVRVCLINFSEYEPKDQLAQRFKDSITETCGIHKIYI
tara:strand:- start:259 stop:726 length:468 start_codon:yes stop_codon:yes gene_type:complete